MIYGVDKRVDPEVPAIDVRDLRKRFGSRTVLDGLDLRVDSGGVVGLLGPNGAGKTTLIRIMAGLLKADAGAISICGIDPARGNGQLGAAIGLAPQDLGLYPQLTTRQNLRCFGEIAGLTRSGSSRQADELLERFGLGACAAQPALRLSGGQRRRLHTAIALMHRPALLFLDEPTVGADVAARAGILAAVAELARQGATVLYTTHYLHELEQLDARIAVLHEGRIAVSGTLREVVDRWARPSVRVRFAGPAPSVAGWEADGGALAPTVAVSDPGAALARLLNEPAVQRAELADVSVVRADLEAAFLAITGTAAGAEHHGAERHTCYADADADAEAEGAADDAR